MKIIIWSDWEKSEHSNPSGNCLEWRISTYSQGASNCVQVAAGVQIRDSKDPGGPVLRFSPPGWAAFTAWLRGPQVCPTPKKCVAAGSCLHGCKQGP